MKCKICKGKAEYFYEWEQSKKKYEIDLCIYCHFQLKGEMLKQQAIEEMADACSYNLK